MTLRKYKKKLMSVGLDRNLSEKQRNWAARMRRGHIGPKSDAILDAYEDHASYYIRVCGGSANRWKAKLAKDLRYIKQHCTV